MAIAVFFLFYHTFSYKSTIVSAAGYYLHIYHILTGFKNRLRLAVMAGGGGLIINDADSPDDEDI